MIFRTESDIGVSRSTERGRAFDTKSFLPWRLKIFSPAPSNLPHSVFTNGKGERRRLSTSLRSIASRPGASILPGMFPGTTALLAG